TGNGQKAGINEAPPLRNDGLCAGQRIHSNHGPRPTIHDVKVAVLSDCNARGISKTATSGNDRLCPGHRIDSYDAARAAESVAISDEDVAVRSNCEPKWLDEVPSRRNDALGTRGRIDSDNAGTAKGLRVVNENAPVPG